MNLEIQTINPTAEPYEGSAVGFLPLDGANIPPAMAGELAAADANGDTTRPPDVMLMVTDKDGGPAFPVWAKVVGARTDEINLHATLTGVHKPGTTKYTVQSMEFVQDAPQLPASVNAGFVPNTYLAFRYQIGDGPIRNFNVRFAVADMLKYQGPKEGNPGFYQAQFNVPLDDMGAAIALRLTFTYLAGEKGLKLRVGVHNGELNRWIKHTPAGDSVYIHRCMVVTTQPSVKPVIDQVAAQQGISPADLVAAHLPYTFDGHSLETYEATIANANTGIGEAEGMMLTIIDGRQKGTVRLNGIGGDIEIAELWAPDGAIPHGNQRTGAGLYASNIRPQEDKPITGSHDPKSAQFVTVVPGLRLIHELYIGFGKPHEQMVRPTILRWSDDALYERAVHTGLPRMASAEVAGEDAARLAAVVSGYAVGPETLFDQRKRGKYYPIPPEKNPMLGYRDYGGQHWGDGFTTSLHYDQLGSMFVNAMGAKSQHVGPWIELARAGAVHALQCGIYMSATNLPNGAGGCTYEKGAGLPGGYAGPAPSHSWIHGLIWQALMFNDFDAIEQLVVFIHHTRNNYSFKGDTYGPDQELAGLDPRDFYNLSSLKRYSAVPPTVWSAIKPGRQGIPGGGDMGDWGARRPPRIGEQLCYLRNLWLAPVEEDIRDNVEQIERLEKHWLENGYFLNRGERSKGFEDYAKPWMHFILARYLNWARATIEMSPEHIALVERVTAVAVDHVILVNGIYFPAGRISIHPGAEGKELVRGGLTPKTVSFLQDANNPGSDEEERIQAWQLFKARFDADVSRNTAEPELPGADQALWNYPALKAFRAMVQTVEDGIPEQGAAAIAMTAPAMLASVNNVTELREYKGILYMSLFSDMLAFRRLKGWNTPDEDALYAEARRGVVWHHQLPRGWGPVISKLGYKLSQYPGSESKAWGAILDTRSLLVDLQRSGE